MDKTKINYRKGGTGIRTSITLSTALVDTWLVAKGLDDEDSKNNGLKAAQKRCRKAPQLAGSPIFPLRFKIGEPSCLATLKMT